MSKNKKPENKSQLTQSQLLAYHLIAINQIVRDIDENYLLYAASEFINTANRNESMIVLNPGYNFSRIELNRLSGKALKTLHEYIQISKKIDECRIKIDKEDKIRKDINNKFL